MYFNINFVSLLQVINILIISMFLSVSTTSDITPKLKFYVEGSGFHRTFIYKIDTGNFIKENCYVSLYLQLPSSLYVNIDELADISRSKKSLICSEGEIDVELFAEKALTQNISVCSATNNLSNISLFIPIHQRYQYATNNGGYINITFPEPELLLGCKDIIKGYRVSKINLCSPCVELVNKWRQIPYKLDNDTYIWQVPVGKSSNVELVTFVTILTTIVGACFVLRTLWQNRLLERKKKY